LIECGDQTALEVRRPRLMHRTRRVVVSADPPCRRAEDDGRNREFEVRGFVDDNGVVAANSSKLFPSRSATRTPI